ncbi:MAG: hypothetical protein PVH64_00770 [Bacillota bacterium]
MKIDLKQLEVTNINNASGFFYGRNIHHSWSAVSKSNQGLGKVFQKSRITATVNLVNDNDRRDFLAQKRQPDS